MPENHQTEFKQSWRDEHLKTLCDFANAGGGVEITENCINAGLFAPQFREAFGGFEIIFNKDIYTGKYLEEKGLNERQIKAVMFTKEKGKNTNSNYQEICSVNRITATRDIQDLIFKKIFFANGSKGRGAYYVIASIAS